MNDEIQNDWADIEAVSHPKPAEEPETAEQIRAEIEATRTEMSETIDALQDKLNPQHIKAQVAEKVHDATIGKAQDLMHTASEKLAPASEKLHEASEKLGEAVAPAAQTAKEKSATLVEFAQQKPLILAGAVLAALALVWSLLRPDDEDWELS